MTDLHGEVDAARLLDLADPLGHKARAVLDGARAVLVGARVVVAAQELLALVEAGRVHLDGVEAHGLEPLGYGHAGVLDGVDLVHGHGFLAHVHAERSPLVAQVRAVLGKGRGQALAELQGLVGDLAGLGAGLQRGHVLHPDHLDAALGEVQVVLEQLVGKTVEVGGAAGGRLADAVAQFELAQLPGREERGKLLGGAAVVAALGVDRRRVEQAVVDGRLGLPRGRLSGKRGRSRSGNGGGDGRRAGTGHERAARDVLVVGHDAFLSLDWVGLPGAPPRGAPR